MTKALPTGWPGRLSALALLLALLALVYPLAAGPLLDLYSDRAATIEVRRAFAAKLGAVAGELPALRKRLAELRTAADRSKFTLDGATDAVASAGLQGHLAELGASAGMAIGSTESLPVESRGGYHRIGLKLLAAGPYESLLKLLAALEAATPPLVVDNLQIHSFQKRPGAASVSTVDASFEVYGFHADKTTDLAKR